MTNAAIEIQAAIYQLLSSSSDLLAELGGNRIHDEAPPKAEPPYVLFSKTVSTDWGTQSENGERHRITLEIWSARNGRKQVLVIERMIREILAEMRGQLDRHFLVHLNWVQSETDMITRQNRFRCRTVFEAVSEPVSASQQ